MPDESTRPAIAPWTLWIPIIFIAMGVMIFYNYTVSQSMQREKDRPPFISSLRSFPGELQERSGKTVSFTDLRGKVLLLAHVYTTCPVGCSDIVSQMKDIYDEFAAKNPDLQFVSFAIDPGDTPARLKQYADANDITKDNWWFVNGDQKVIRAFLTNDVKFIRVIEKPVAEQTSAVDKYMHDMRIALVDDQGRLRGMYDLLNKDPEFRALAKKKLHHDLTYVLGEHTKEAASK